MTQDDATKDERVEQGLCSACFGNGVLTIPGGVSTCHRCDGAGWEPTPRTFDLEVQLKASQNQIASLTADLERAQAERDEYKMVAEAAEQAEMRFHADCVRAESAFLTAQEEIARLKETNQRLNRRCQVAEAPANLRAEAWDKRSTDQGRNYLYSQLKAAEEEITRLTKENLELGDAKSRARSLQQLTEDNLTRWMKLHEEVREALSDLRAQIQQLELWLRANSDPRFGPVADRLASLGKE